MIYSIAFLLALHNGTKGSFGDDALFDDDYIEMDPLYTEPPLESDDDDHDGTLKANLSEERDQFI